MAYPICHLFVLGSACFNPLLYGWLNDNFRREFVKALCCCSKSWSTARGVTTIDPRSNGARSMPASVVGAAGRPRRFRRRPSDDIQLELRKRYSGEKADESANDPEQLMSLVSKWLRRPPRWVIACTGCTEPQPSDDSQRNNISHQRQCHSLKILVTVLHDYHTHSMDVVFVIVMFCRRAYKPLT